VKIQKNLHILKHQMKRNKVLIFIKFLNIQRKPSRSITLTLHKMLSRFLCHNKCCIRLIFQDNTLQKQLKSFNKILKLIDWQKKRIFKLGPILKDKNKIIIKKKSKQKTMSTSLNPKWGKITQEKLNSQIFLKMRQEHKQLWNSNINLSQWNNLETQF